MTMNSESLIIEILVRLPIKTLIRFKLVSKHFCSIISAPNFTLRRNPNPNPPAGLFLPLPLNNTLSSFYYDILPLPLRSRYLPPPLPLPKQLNHKISDITIESSCNGLLLCTANPSEIHRTWCPYFVCNPTTNTSTVVQPSYYETETDTEFVGVSLAFDPSNSLHYKVVFVRKLQSLPEYQVLQLEVFNSGTGKTTKRGKPFDAAEIDFPNGVYWNGSIHWIALNPKYDSIYFNPDDYLDRIQIMPKLPGCCDKGKGHSWFGNYYFGESYGHLHFAEHVHNNIVFNMYEMRMDYSEWFVKYRVDLSPVIASYPEMVIPDDPEDFYSFEIYSVVRCQSSSFMILKVLGELVRYGFEDEWITTLYEFTLHYRTTMRCPTDKGIQYIQSLYHV